MTKMTNKTAQLVINGGEHVVDLPIHQGTLGHDVIEIAQLSKHELFTFDPGFVSTASCESKITYIDGENGNFFICPLLATNTFNKHFTSVYETFQANNP